MRRFVFRSPRLGFLAVGPALARPAAAFYRRNRAAFAPFDPVQPEDFFTEEGQAERLAEELGFVGAVLIIVLFVLFIVQGLLIAYKAENLYCTMVGIGIMAQIAWQVFCNIAVVTNTLPNTGISLPFFSSGGTSLILLLAEMGVMVNIGRNGERAAQQREQMRAQREAARAEREAELARKTIDLASARAARTEQ